MDLRSIKPGLSGADLFGKVHPRTGQPIVPLGYTRDGRAIWPVIGAEGDDTDPNDPRFTGGGPDPDDEDDDAEDDSEEDDGDDKAKRDKGKQKSDDDEDDDEDDPRLARASRQAAKYRTQLRATEAKNAELERRLRAIEDKDKKPEEIKDREVSELQSTNDRLTQANRDLHLRLAVLTTPVRDVEWADVEDVIRLVDLSDVDVDDDGTVDRKALRIALRDLARRKPHLVVKKARGRSSSDEDNEDESDDDQRSSAPPMNGKRKGEGRKPDRAALAKRFTVLNRGGVRND